MTSLSLFSATTTTNEAVTMTSLEIVDFINDHRKAEAKASGYAFPCEKFAKLRHDHFMDKVPDVLGGVPLDRETYRHPQNGQTYECYRFQKREACLMAMSYSYELQAAVFDHMTKLENALLGKVCVSNATLPTQAAPQFKILFELATLIGCDNNAAAISANQGTIATTGLDLLGIMGLKALPSPEQAIYYTPTELGKQCTPVLSAIKINARLYAAGLQHNAAGHWEATEAGKPYARTLDTGKKHNSGVPVQQVKWLAKVLEVAGVAK